MSSLPAARSSLISVDDYLREEASREIKHEYLAGQLVAMGGASRAHGLIAGELFALLKPHARRKGCQLFIADMKVRIDHEGDTWFYYPDLVLDCHGGEADAFFVRNPCLIVEVLSAGTEHIDTREKLLAYRLLPDLRAYLLLRQDRVQADLYVRDAGSPWQHERHTGGTLRLPCVDAEVALADVYQDALGMLS